MHELSVTESILEITLRHAGQKPVTDIYMVVGQLASIVDDSVSFYWDIISQGTAAQGARLHFRRIPAEFACQDCSQHYPPTQDNLACPACSSTRVKMVHGNEFFIEAIEVENSHAPTPASS